MVNFGDVADGRFRLDPKRLPKKLELELTEDCLEYLKRQSQQSGRSIDEILVQILNDRINQEGLGD